MDYIFILWLFLKKNQNKNNYYLNKFKLNNKLMIIKLNNIMNNSFPNSIIIFNIN